jgi:uncharacterized protein YecT (DUF1311 family)
MPTDRIGDPWSDTTYNGFAGVAPPPRRRLRLPPMTRRNLAIGTAAALVLGIAGGLLLRPDLGSKGYSDSTARPGQAVPIEVNHPPPLPAPTSSGKLEVLPPEQAAAARAAVAPPPVAPVAPSVSYVPAGPPPLPAVSPSAALTPPPAVRQPPPLQAAPPRAGADCSGARSPAEAMVCGDPDLTAADRELNRAYQRALRSGAAPPGALRADQRDWLAIREQAARRSPRAVAQVYQQRIDELNAVADGDEGDGPGF